MSVIYAASSSLITFVVNYKASGPVGLIFTYVQRRGFLSFDLSASGLTLPMISSATLILNCTSLNGGGCTVSVHSAIDPDGWGAALTASNADWKSTATKNEGTVDVFGTGLISVPVDKTNISYTGVTYYRLVNFNEGEAAPYNTGAIFSAREEGLNSPVLQLTTLAGQTEKILTAQTFTEKTMA